MSGIENLGNMTLEEKRALARKILEKKKALQEQNQTEKVTAHAGYESLTYDMFVHSLSQELTEVNTFAAWMDSARKDGIYAFESPRLTGQRAEVEILRETGETLRALNFSSYNYLGFCQHPQVLESAKNALYKYGLGAASSPVLSGTFGIHAEFEKALVDFFALPDRGITLFSSGYSANLGTISAIAGPGNHVIMDKACHISIIEGAKLSGATLHFFAHNDPTDLARMLQTLAPLKQRMLVCMEGIYSADGDFGRIRELVQVSKEYGALTLVDEAHSALIAGENGRGVCEEQGVLEEVDLFIMTLSKAFSGIGGALLAKKSVAQYVNWYAKCRMFSCALDPAVTGGMTTCVKLAGGNEGKEARKRIKTNAALLRSLLEGQVELGASATWILTVFYHDELKTLKLNDYLQRNGIDCSTMQFPAVPKNEARIRLFVTSEHTEEHIRKAAEILLKAAEVFSFATK
jgi:7-keto-8-aminopelargonate synthetase-like enzyme